MTEHCYGGIDVSKDRLDVMVLPDRKSFSVDNNAAGYSELVIRQRDFDVRFVPKADIHNFGRCGRDYCRGYTHKGPAGRSETARRMNADVCLPPASSAFNIVMP